MSIITTSHESNNQYFTTHNIYNLDKSKSYKKPYHNFSDTQFNTKKQFITNDISNYITRIL